METPAAYSGKHCSAALRWLVGISEPNYWDLTPAQQCVLLGGISYHDYFGWCRLAAEKKDVELPRDAMERLSYLLGIFKGLHYIVPSPEMSCEWFSRPNTGAPFNGKSVKEFLLTNPTLEALHQARRYFDAIPHE